MIVLHLSVETSHLEQLTRYDHSGGAIIEPECWLMNDTTPDVKSSLKHLSDCFCVAPQYDFFDMID